MAIANNGLRIFVIAELGTPVDWGFLDGNLHHHGGIVFLGVAMVVVIALIWFLHRWEVGRPRQLHARLSCLAQGEKRRAEPTLPTPRGAEAILRKYVEQFMEIFDAFDL
jgi:hypothetical protein